MNSIQLLSLLIRAHGGMVSSDVKLAFHAVSCTGFFISRPVIGWLLTLIAAFVGDRTGTAGCYTMFRGFRACSCFRQFFSYSSTGPRVEDRSPFKRTCCREWGSLFTAEVCGEGRGCLRGCRYIGNWLRKCRCRVIKHGRQ